MRSNFAKTIFVAITAVLVTTSVVAQSSRSRNMKQQKLEQGHVINNNQMMPAYNAPARYDVQGGWDVWFRGDFLYMQALEDNLPYAVSTTDANAANPPLGDVLLVDFDWHPGFKVAFGFNSDHDDWGIFADWMHYISRNNTSSGSPSTTGALWGTTTTNPDSTSRTLSQVSSTWGLTFNSWDLMLNRAYYVGKRLTYDFMVGLRGSYLKQKFSTENVFSVAANGTSQADSKWDSWGLGPRVGLNTNWLIGSGFRIFGNVAGALEWNRFNSSLNETNASIAPASHSAGVVTSVNENEYNVVRPNMDLELGFAWGTYFDNSNWHVDLTLAYEFHQWWSQNLMMNFVDDIQRGKFVQGGDLGIHGGSFGLRFDF